MKLETLKTLEQLLTGLVVMDFKKEAEEKIHNCLKEIKEAIAVAHSCEKLPCENCGENKQLKYCEKCYNTAFDTENQ